MLVSLSTLKSLIMTESRKKGISIEELPARARVSLKSNRELLELVEEIWEGEDDGLFYVKLAETDLPWEWYEWPGTWLPGGAPREGLPEVEPVTNFEYSPEEILEMIKEWRRYQEESLAEYLETGDEYVHDRVTSVEYEAETELSNLEEFLEGSSDASLDDLWGKALSELSSFVDEATQNASDANEALSHAEEREREAAKHDRYVRWLVSEKKRSLDALMGSVSEPNNDVKRPEIVPGHVWELRGDYRAISAETFRAVNAWFKKNSS